MPHSFLWTARTRHARHVTQSNLACRQPAQRPKHTSRLPIKGQVAAAQVMVDEESGASPAAPSSAPASQVRARAHVVPTVTCHGNSAVPASRQLLGARLARGEGMLALGRALGGWGRPRRHVTVRQSASACVRGCIQCTLRVSASAGQLGTPRLFRAGGVQKAMCASNAGQRLGAASGGGLEHFDEVQEGGACERAGTAAKHESCRVGCQRAGIL